MINSHSVVSIDELHKWIGELYVENRVLKRVIDEQQQQKSTSVNGGTFSKEEETKTNIQQRNE